MPSTERMIQPLFSRQEAMNGSSEVTLMKGKEVPLVMQVAEKERLLEEVIFELYLRGRLGELEVRQRKIP